MRSFALYVLSAALVSVGVSALPHSRDTGNHYNPTGIKNNKFLESSNGPTRVKRESDSNAERLARGLPPLSPKRLYEDSEKRAQPSGCPSVTKIGNIAVKSDGVTLGYIRKTPNKFGEYGITEHGDDLATFAFEQSSCYNPGSPVDIVALDGPLSADFKYFGAVSGYDSPDNNLSVGKHNYAYLVGVKQPVPASSPAVWTHSSFWYATSFIEEAQTAIWNYDPSSHDLIPRWINEDGAKAATQIVFYPGDNSLALTGDPAAFNAKYGLSPTVTLAFDELI